ncbi:PREDICTED: dynein light chain 1, axonemal-like [Ceratosolen solmsi marchali]|uniref:Dynein axonemal light chain 1 n=1 Tax=Ceratosolen solmsi marchali TaxID=326594 RepID=A0AAJ6YVE1_9HYME|nr:PREDICTED: dynein light chain 1, axonemal-like [Ceratosolen solmsi marchali]
MASSGKPTTCKDAIKRWEECNGGADASTATEVCLDFQWLPIERMDNSLSVLGRCEHLSLSTNMIEKIAGVGSLKCLRILSLGRNQIKSFAGLEILGDTLEELWISYNAIEKMKGVTALRNLRVLYMSNNLVREWNEFTRLQELPNLQDLVFSGNPITETLELEQWRVEVTRRLPNLAKLDGEPLVHTIAEEVVQAPKNETPS